MGNTPSVRFYDAFDVPPPGAAGKAVDPQYRSLEAVDHCAQRFWALSHGCLRRTSPLLLTYFHGRPSPAPAAPEVPPPSTPGSTGTQPVAVTVWRCNPQHPSAVAATGKGGAHASIHKASAQWRPLCDPLRVAAHPALRQHHGAAPVGVVTFAAVVPFAPDQKKQQPLAAHLGVRPFDPQALPELTRAVATAATPGQDPKAAPSASPLTMAGVAAAAEDVSAFLASAQGIVLVPPPPGHSSAGGNPAAAADPALVSDVFAVSVGRWLPLGLVGGQHKGRGGVDTSAAPYALAQAAPVGQHGSTTAMTPAVQYCPLELLLGLADVARGLTTLHAAGIAHRGVTWEGIVVQLDAVGHRCPWAVADPQFSTLHATATVSLLPSTPLRAAAAPGGVMSVAASASSSTAVVPVADPAGDGPGNQFLAAAAQLRGPQQLPFTAPEERDATRRDATGAPPHAADLYGFGALLASLLPPAPPHAVPGVPRECTARCVVESLGHYAQHCLHPDPRQRPPSLSAFVELPVFRRSAFLRVMLALDGFYPDTAAGATPSSTLAQPLPLHVRLRHAADAEALAADPAAAARAAFFATLHLELLKMPYDVVLRRVAPRLALPAVWNDPAAAPFLEHLLTPILKTPPMSAPPLELLAPARDGDDGDHFAVHGVLLAPDYAPFVTRAVCRMFHSPTAAPSPPPEGAREDPQPPGPPSLAQDPQTYLLLALLRGVDRYVFHVDMTIVDRVVVPGVIRLLRHFCPDVVAEALRAFAVLYRFVVAARDRGASVGPTLGLLRRAFDREVFALATAPVVPHGGPARGPGAALLGGAVPVAVRVAALRIGMRAFRRDRLMARPFAVRSLLAALDVGAVARSVSLAPDPVPAPAAAQGTTPERDEAERRGSGAGAAHDDPPLPSAARVAVAALELLQPLLRDVRHGPGEAVVLPPALRPASRGSSVSAASGDGGAQRRLVQRAETLLALYAPTRRGEGEALLRKYHGREGQLIPALVKELGPEPRDGSGSPMQEALAAVDDASGGEDAQQSHPDGAVGPEDPDGGGGWRLDGEDQGDPQALSATPTPSPSFSAFSPGHSAASPLGSPGPEGGLSDGDGMDMVRSASRGSLRGSLPRRRSTMASLLEDRQGQEPADAAAAASVAAFNEAVSPLSRTGPQGLAVPALKADVGTVRGTRAPVVGAFSPVEIARDVLPAVASLALLVPPGPADGTVTPPPVVAQAAALRPLGDLAGRVLARLLVLQARAGGAATPPPEAEADLEGSGSFSGSFALLSNRSFGSAQSATRPSALAASPMTWVSASSALGRPSPVASAAGAQAAATAFVQGAALGHPAPLPLNLAAAPRRATVPGGFPAALLESGAHATVQAFASPATDTAFRFVPPRAAQGPAADDGTPPQLRLRVALPRDDYDHEWNSAGVVSLTAGGATFAPPGTAFPPGTKGAVGSGAGANTRLHPLGAKLPTRPGGGTTGGAPQGFAELGAPSKASGSKAVPAAGVEKKKRRKAGALPDTAPASAPTDPKADLPAKADDAPKSDPPPQPIEPSGQASAPQTPLSAPKTPSAGPQPAGRRVGRATRARHDSVTAEEAEDL